MMEGDQMSHAPEKSPLQAMIDSAAPGAVIKLRPGEYLGAVVIDKPITVEGHGKKTWIGAKTSPVVLVKCGGVTLRNVMIEGLARGAVGLEALASASPVIDDVEFRGMVRIIPGAGARSSSFDVPDHEEIPPSFTPLLTYSDSTAHSRRKQLAAHWLTPLLTYSDSTGWTPLHSAAERGDNPAIGRLLIWGARVNALNHDGWAPLHIASQRGHLEVVERLLDRGANIHAVGPGGKTALALAKERGHQDVVALLCRRGAGE